MQRFVADIVLCLSVTEVKDDSTRHRLWHLFQLTYNNMLSYHITKKATLE